MKRKPFCRQKINIQLRHNYQKTVKDIAATLQKAQKQAIRIPHGNVFTQKRAKKKGPEQPAPCRRKQETIWPAQMS